MIDFYRDDFKEKVAKLDKSKPVFVYCLAGGRSKSAAKIMADLGFAAVYDLSGGYRAPGHQLKRKQ
ncbi:MAG: rhodanese-like domain-containing protein [Bacteroidetes bacterium]|nr:rhodanese-like domain-containing protein [Bacteroidota bacterium]MBS1541734.1 rhodanese-like domain-containing protein [Bacteroidota bacterium]